MKTQIKTLILGAVFCLSMSSCSDFIEEKPYSFISPDNFYSTLGEAEIALNGTYRTLNNIWSVPYINCNNLGVDEAAYKLVKEDNTPHAANTFSPSIGEHVNLWVTLYSGINRANFLIERVPLINDEDLGKNRIIAEAKFLRAFFYSHLAWMFGGVPIQTTTEMLKETPRANLEEVYSLIFSDLQFAYENLPAKAGKDGKASRFAAAGLLARNCLYLAQCKDNQVSADLAALYAKPELISFTWVNSSQMYADAKTYLKDIYDNGGYSLIARYDQLFYAETENIAKAEMVFDVQFKVIESDPVYLSLQNYLCPKGTRRLGGGLMWNTVSSEMYVRYNQKMDKRFAHNIVGQLDERDEVAYFIDGKKYYPVKAWTNKTSSVGKWRRSTFDSRPEMPDWASDINMPFLRYADVLLLYAEASFKTDDEVFARQLVTKVRARSLVEGQTIENLNKAYFNADFMKELLDERSRELCFEGWRRWDLIRMGKIDQVVKQLDPTATKYNFTQSMVALTRDNWEPYRIWFPIPLREMDLNKNLVQNPGF